MTGSIATVAIIVYALVLVAIGAVSLGNTDKPESYYLADRTLGTLEVAGSTFSTFLGTGLMFTLAAFGFLYGVGTFALLPAALVGLGLLTAASPRLHQLADGRSAITLPALMAQSWRPRTRTVAALVTIGLFTATLAANLVVVSEVLQVVSDIPPTVGMVVIGGIAIGYTTVGGFRAVVRTDLVQAFLILVGFVIVLPLVILTEVGGSIQITLPSSQLDPSSFPLPLFAVYLVVGTFAFFGSQDLLQRIFAARDATTARRGLLVFTGLFTLTGMAAIFLGIVARALVPQASAAESLLALTEGVISATVGAVVILGFLALANSDADSQLLTVASNVRLDLGPGPLDRLLSEHPVGDRIVVSGLGAVALLIAWVAPSVSALLNAVGSWFAILGVVVLATLFWERTTDRAAFFGLLIGFVLPPVFIAVNGSAEAAAIVGLVPAVVIVVGGSLVSGRRLGGGSDVST